MNRTTLITQVIINHLSWHKEVNAHNLATEIEEALQGRARVDSRITDDDAEAIRRIVFPTQTHREDRAWGAGLIKSVVTVANILRDGK